MGVPANLFSREAALDQFKRAAQVLRARSVAIRADAASRPINTNEVLGYLAVLRATRDLIDALPTSQEFKDYAQASLAAGGYTGDIVADGAAMKTQVVATIDWIVGVSGNLWAGHSLSSTGGEVVTTFSTAQTATFRTAVQSLIDTIDG